MAYLQLTIHCKPEIIDSLGTQLLEFGANGATENLDSLDVYFDEEQFNKEEIIELISTLDKNTIQRYSFSNVEDTNWNLLWESNYQPIEVDSLCYIHAPFHQLKSGFKYTIEINPRMAFGTGHHETTHMMIQTVEQVDVTNKNFLDLGCGTGILAIMASLEGASKVTAIDIDENAVNTLEENFYVNNIENATYLQGTIDTILQKDKVFDVVFANINKNVLMNDAEKIIQATKENGYIALSGFYIEDNNDIIEQFSKFGVQLLSKKDRNNWSSLLFKKSKM